MAWDRIERRRSAEQRIPVPDGTQGTSRDRRSLSRFKQVHLYDAATGFYTMPALIELIQYEIDGSAQTMRNELYVTPLCLAAIEVEPPHGVKDDLQSERFVQSISEALRGVTRVADRVARHGFGFVALLRRTLAKSVAEHYAPRLAANVAESCAEWGASTTSIGIASLVEHVARSPDHMVRMAVRALEEARKAPGSAVIYDFRVMTLD